jgi:hypothetical protein
MAQDWSVHAGVYFCGVDGVLCPDLFYWPLDLESADMKTIIEMAREADPKANLNEPYCLDHETRAWLERFAALVAAAEFAKREWNFCERCGKRTADLTVIHTCTPPQENT